MSSSGQGTGCDCGLVDAHTHWVPHQFPAYVGQRKSVAWPSMAPAAAACDRNVMLNGRVYRTVPDASQPDFSSNKFHTAERGHAPGGVADA